MTTIDLKFSPDMAKAALEGRKCCTSRRSRKGDAGDEFEIEGVRFRLLNVLYVPVLEITLNYYLCEGFAESAPCSLAIRDLYPDLGAWDRLFVHFFARCP